MSAIVAEIEKSANEKILFSLSEFKDQNYADIRVYASTLRVYYENGEGKWKLHQEGRDVGCETMFRIKRASESSSPPKAFFRQLASAPCAASQEKGRFMTDITFKNNGPILVTGDFVLKDPESGEFDVAGRKTIGLCRCGASENKPFCDGAHKRVEFESEVKARQLPPPAVKP